MDLDSLLWPEHLSSAESSIHNTRTGHEQNILKIYITFLWIWVTISRLSITNHILSLSWTLSSPSTTKALRVKGAYRHVQNIAKWENNNQLNCKMNEAGKDVYWRSKSVWLLRADSLHCWYFIWQERQVFGRLNISHHRIQFWSVSHIFCGDLIKSEQRGLWEAFWTVHKALGMPWVPVCNRGQGRGLFSFYFFCLIFFSKNNKRLLKGNWLILQSILQWMHRFYWVINSSVVISNMASVLNNWIGFFYDGRIS